MNRTLSKDFGSVFVERIVGWENIAFGKAPQQPWDRVIRVGFLVRL